MSNIGTAIQQSVGILAMLVNQGQRKECRNSTESTGTRATSNFDPQNGWFLSPFVNSFIKNVSWG